MKRYKTNQSIYFFLRKFAYQIFVEKFVAYYYYFLKSHVYCDFPIPSENGFGHFKEQASGQGSP